MYGVAAALDPFIVQSDNRIPLAITFAAAGVLLILIGGYQFRQASTTVNPLAPQNSARLVTDGLYRYSRNPMYLGFLLFLLAWAAFLGSLLALLLVPFFVFSITRFQIKHEERILEQKFGDPYRLYLKQVRRWL